MLICNEAAESCFSVVAVPPRYALIFPVKGWVIDSFAFLAEGRRQFWQSLAISAILAISYRLPSIASHTFLVSTFWVYFTIFPSLKFHMWAKTASITPPDFL